MPRVICDMDECRFNDCGECVNDEEVNIDTNGNCSTYELRGGQDANKG